MVLANRQIAGALNKIYEQVWASVVKCGHLGIGRCSQLLTVVYGL